MSWRDLAQTAQTQSFMERRGERECKGRGPKGSLKSQPKKRVTSCVRSPRARASQLGNPAFGETSSATPGTARLAETRWGRPERERGGGYYERE